MNNNFNKKIYWLLIPLVIYFLFGLHHLTQFETADEHYWFYEANGSRISRYWDSIALGNWAGTRINDKPGVTLALVSGIGLPLERNFDFENLTSAERMEKINLYYRLPQLVFIGLFSLVFFWLIKKVTENEWIALLSSSLILLSPILLGIAQIVNPDSLVWVFSTAAILSFLAYLKDEENKFIPLAAFFFALALLSKYVAVILMPFFFFIAALHFIYSHEKWRADHISLRRKLLKFLLATAGIMLGGLLIFSLLMPAVLTDISYLYEGTIGFKQSSPVYLFLIFIAFNIGLILDALILKSKTLVWFLGKTGKIKIYLPKAVFFFMGAVFLLTLANWSLDNLFDVKNLDFDLGRDSKFKKLDIAQKIILELRPIVFSLTPLVLFSLIFSWFRAAFKKSKLEWVMLVLTLFFIFYYAAVIQQGLLVHIRYSSMLYPLAIVISAIGLYEIFAWKKLERINKFGVFIAIVAISAISLWLIKPFYFNYTSGLLAKNRTIAGAWGYGGYEAARYLNSIPNAQNLTIWADYWGVCNFFRGKCIQLSSIKKNAYYQDVFEKNNPVEGKAALVEELDTEEENEEEKSTSLTAERIDYYVVTRRGSTLNKKIWLKLKASVETPEWELLIGNRPDNYIKVYKNKME